MQPTLPASKEHILVDVLSHRLLQRQFEMYDIVVVFETIEQRSRLSCKRIIGLSGDLIVYLQTKPQKLVICVVPLDCVWLAGDNHKYSDDSRVYGPVPKKFLEGRVFLKMGWYPPHICQVDRPVRYDQFILRTKGQVTNYSKSYNVTKNARSICLADRDSILRALEQNKNVSDKHRKYIIDRLATL